MFLWILCNTESLLTPVCIFSQKNSLWLIDPVKEKLTFLEELGTVVTRRIRIKCNLSSNCKCKPDCKCNLQQNLFGIARKILLLNMHQIYTEGFSTHLNATASRNGLFLPHDWRAGLLLTLITRVLTSSPAQTSHPEVTPS